MLDSLLTAENVAWAVGALVALLAGAGLVTSEVRKRNVALVVKHGALIARDIADSTEGKDAFDVVAAALLAADQELKQRGWRPLTDAEKLAAVGEVKAFNAALNLGARSTPK